MNGWRGTRSQRAGIAAAVVLVVVAVGVGVALTRGDSPSSEPTSKASAPQTMTATRTRPTGKGAGEELQARLHASGVPMSVMSRTKLHIHPVLRVFVNGKRMKLPGDVGITPDFGMAALHTHDGSGTIHVESPVKRAYTLGQFFDVWGVKLTKTCIGTYCGGRGIELHTFVDGKPVGGNPRNVRLRDKEEIVLAIGSPRQIKAVAPKS